VIHETLNNPCKSDFVRVQKLFLRLSLVIGVQLRPAAVFRMIDLINIDVALVVFFPRLCWNPGPVPLCYASGHEERAAAHKSKLLLDCDLVKDLFEEWRGIYTLLDLYPHSSRLSRDRKDIRRTHCLSLHAITPRAPRLL
jgi:hypothetical protein